MTPDYIELGRVPQLEVPRKAASKYEQAETEIFKRQLEREFPKGDFRVAHIMPDGKLAHIVLAWFAPGEHQQDQHEAAHEAQSSAYEHWDYIAIAELEQLAHAEAHSTQT